MEQLAEQLMAFVRSNPGLHIEQINQGLGTSTEDLALAKRKLVAEGAITTKGQKRSTTYFASKKGHG